MFRITLLINHITILLCILCQAVATATMTMSVDQHIMNVYHQIHHIELSHGTHPDNSVLLDLTRRRLSKHFGIDYEDLQLPIVDKNDAMSVVDELEKNHFPISNGDGIHPYSIDSLIDLEIYSKTDLAIESTVNGPSTSLLRSNRGALGNLDAINKAAADSNKLQPTKIDETYRPSARIQENVQVARDLAKDMFDIDEDYTLPEEDRSEEDRSEDQSVATDEMCADICSCMGDELLFGITKSIPYIPSFCLKDEKADEDLTSKILDGATIENANWCELECGDVESPKCQDIETNRGKSACIIKDECDCKSLHIYTISKNGQKEIIDKWKKKRSTCHKEGNLIFEWKISPDLDPIWYRKDIETKKWLWNGKDPRDSDNDKWQSVTEDDSGYWEHVFIDVPDENKFMIKLLNDFNPDDDGSCNGWTVPGDSDTSVPDFKATDFKGDLRVCSARKNKSPSEACQCKESTCLKDVVSRYFKFIQISGNALKERKENTELILDLVQTGVSLLGMIDPYGLLADLLNAGISAARRNFADAIMDVVVAIPAIGTALLPVKWVDKMKGVTKLKYIFKWATKAKLGLTSPKALKKFAKELGEYANNEGGDAAAKFLGIAAKVLVKIATTVIWIVDKGKLVLEKIDKKTGVNRIVKKIKEIILAILKKIGCTESSSNSPIGKQMRKWGIVILTKIGEAMDHFDMFKPASAWLNTISSCLAICAVKEGEDDNDDTKIAAVKECAKALANKIGDALDPCWYEMTETNEETKSDLFLDMHDDEEPEIDDETPEIDDKEREKNDDIEFRKGVEEACTVQDIYFNFKDDQRPHDQPNDGAPSTNIVDGNEDVAGIKLAGAITLDEHGIEFVGSVDGKNIGEMTQGDVIDAVETVFWNTTETAANWFKDFLLEYCTENSVVCELGMDLKKLVEEAKKECENSIAAKIEARTSTFSPAESVVQEETTNLPPLHNNAGESSEAQIIKSDEEIHGEDSEEAETSLQEMQKALQQDGEEKEQEMNGENAGESSEEQNIKPDEEVLGGEAETGSKNSFRKMQKSLEQDGDEKEQAMMESLN